MTVEEMIRDVNSLPSNAQHQVVELIAALKAKYQDAQVENELKKHGAAKPQKYGIEDGFGMFKVDTPMTLEDIENGIALAMQDKFGHLTKE